METGEWLTRGTVWIALALYVASEILKAAGSGAGSRVTARWLNSLGCAAFLAHVVCAFHFYHRWSHAVAYADTARQTAERFGWQWGGGLYLNYFFALTWISEAIWIWTNPSGYLRRPKWMTWTVRGFFWFMMFNGTVVFTRGAVRWFGLTLCLALMGCWWPNRKRITRSPDQLRPD